MYGRYDEKKAAPAWPLPFYIGVDLDGRLRLLKEHRHWLQHLPSGGAVSHHGWVIPEHLREGPRDKPDDWSPELSAKIAFGWAYQGYSNASMDIRIRASKNGVVGAFSVDLLRTPYFFADRNPVFHEKGHKRKIFHIVRTHERKFKKGGSTFVRSHFRGLRAFDWNGYQLLITMPETHHRDLLDFHAGAHDVEASNYPESDLLSMPELGEKLDKLLTS